MLRPVLRPRWVAGHLGVLGLCVAMVFLGRWQWHVGQHHHDLRNYGYALQWWCFSAIGAALYLRVVREVVRHERAAEAAPSAQQLPSKVAYRRYVMPPARPDADPEIGAYNEYLARLADPPEDAP